MLTLSAMLTSISPISIALKALASPVAAISCKLLELVDILGQLEYGVRERNIIEALSTKSRNILPRAVFPNFFGTTLEDFKHSIIWSRTYFNTNMRI
jgi:hypothetical protein